MKILIFPRPLTISLDKTAGIGSRTLHELQTRLIESTDYHFAITSLSLLDPGTTNAYLGTTFVLVNPLSPPAAELDILSDAPMIQEVKVRMHTAEGYNRDMTFTVEVCGTEILYVASTQIEFSMLMWEGGNVSTMVDSTRYHLYNQSVLNSFFALTPPGSGCAVKYMEVVTDMQYDVSTAQTSWTSWNISNTNVTLQGAYTGHTLRLDKTVQNAHLIFKLMALTKGLNAAVK